MQFVACVEVKDTEELKALARRLETLGLDYEIYRGYQVSVGSYVIIKGETELSLAEKLLCIFH